MKATGEVTSQEVEALFNMIDKDKSGALSLDVSISSINKADYFNEQLPPDQSDSSWAGLD